MAPISYAPFVVAAIAALATRSILQLCIVLVGAVALSVTPQLREFGDVVLGHVRRFISAYNSIVFDDKSKASPRTRAQPSQQVKNQTNDSVAPISSSADQTVQLHVPKELLAPLDSLLGLIVRDFVAWWFDTSIAMGGRGSDRFLLETRSALNSFTNAVTRRMLQLDHNETATHILQSATTAMVQAMTHQGEPAQDKTARLAQERIALIDRMRQIGEELVITFSPSAMTASPAISALLTEIVTSQLFNVVLTMDEDWLNQTIVGFFENAPPEMVAQAVEDGVSLESLAHSSARSRPSMARLALETYEAGDQEFCQRYLADVKATTSTRKPKLSHKGQLLLQTFSRPGDATADDFQVRRQYRQLDLSVLSDLQTYVESLPADRRDAGDALLRALNALISVQRALDASAVTEETREQDCYSALLRASNILGAACSTEELESALTASMVAKSTEALRNCIIERLESDFWPAFADTRRSSGPIAASNAPVDLLTSSPPRRSIDETVGGSQDGYTIPEAALSKISVTVMDISAPSAYDVRGLVKSKRDLAFMCQVEAPGTNGFVIQRTWADLEKLESALVRAFPRAGTPAFPRALFPGTAHRNSEALIAGLTAYLETLLSDRRYAASTPVAKFFERERTIGGSQTPFSFFDELAQTATEGLMKTGELASRGVTSGIGTMASVVSSPLNAILLPAEKRSSFGQASSPAPSASPARTSMPRTKPVQKPSSSSAPSNSTMAPKEPRATLTARADPLSAENPASEPGHAATSSARTASKPAVPVSGEVQSLSDQPSSRPPSSERKRVPVPSYSPEGSAATLPERGPFTADQLNGIVASCMTLLESAYNIEEGEWSFRRGMIRVLETIVRTTGLVSLEVALASSLSSLDAKTIARKIEDLRSSFWPDGIWYATKGIEVPVRTPEQQRETAAKARVFIIRLAPDPLRIALGPAATNDAFARIHGALTSSSTVGQLLLDCLRMLIL